VITRRKCLGLFALSACGAFSTKAFAAQPTYTTIIVDDMHCGSCAKKIAAQLYAVPGVIEVRADVKKSAAYVVPQKRKTPSPRLMWEAVEKAGFKTVKMIGPGGSFSQKPRS
jgi:copper chaperone CopZ